MTGYISTETFVVLAATLIMHHVCATMSQHASFTCAGDKKAGCCWIRLRLPSS